MAELTPLARPYASAVFQLANETGTQEQWSSILSVLTQVVQDDKITTLLANSTIDSNMKANGFADALGGNCSEDQIRFIALLAKNNRLAVLPVIERLYQGYINEQMQAEEVDVYSAFPLQETQLADIKEKISRNLKKNVSLVQHQDSTLIGGIRIQGKGWIMDASIHGQVKNLARSLTI